MKVRGFILIEIIQKARCNIWSTHLLVSTHHFVFTHYLVSTQYLSGVYRVVEKLPQRGVSLGKHH
jgi:hypothetical protein